MQEHDLCAHKPQLPRLRIRARVHTPDARQMAARAHTSDTQADFTVRSSPHSALLHNRLTASDMVLAAQVTGTQPAQMLTPVAGRAALRRGRRSSAASSRRHGNGSCHIDPTKEDALGASAAVTLAGAGISISSRSDSSGRGSGSGSFSGTDAQHSSRSGDSSSREAGSSGSGGGARAAAETAAAMLSSLGTAFFEGPLEVFQHRAQVHPPTPDNIWLCQLLMLWLTAIVQCHEMKLPNMPRLDCLKPRRQRA